MPDDKEIFVDGIGQIHFLNGMVRYDLISLQPNQENQKQPIPEMKARIIMPPEGFLRTFDTMQKLIDQLSEAGIIKKKEKSN
ncbi:MAG: hypothetical protein A2020_04055 [Lentisphaerae bacterium GWF2_45_14]|nr:MAG: hypothetical protein A2020_04055 [Lentisphaerae bacterium GWF2_45_14]